MTRWTREATVAVIVFPGDGLFKVSIPISVFGVDRSEAGVPRFQVLVCSERPGLVESNSGTSLVVPHDLSVLPHAGTVVIPTWPRPTDEPPSTVVAAVREAHRHGSRIVGLCYGALVLAAGGLLDGRRATTHWLAVDLLAERYPTVEVLPDALYVDEGDVITSAGAAAGLDACLHLLRRDHGVGVANTVARHLVVPPHRDGGQAQYIASPLADVPGDDAVDMALRWAESHLADDVTVPELAARAHLSRRTLERHVLARTGQTPLQWLISRRVRLAQELLERTDLSIEQVAQRSGLGAGQTMRLHFHRLVGTTPQRYRASFASAP